MKYKIALLIILFPVFAIAQTNKDSLASKTISDLKEFWTLGVDSTNQDGDAKVATDFKSLFTKDAIIDDDFNAVYRPQSAEDKNPYIIEKKSKTFDEYAKEVTYQIRSLKYEINKPDSNFSNPNAMTYTFTRKVTATKKGKFVLINPEQYADYIMKERKIKYGKENGDSTTARKNLIQVLEKAQDDIYRFTATSTINITMKLENDTVKITNMLISKNDTALTCANDADNDAIINSNDSLNSMASDMKGDFTSHGRPDYDLDGVPDAVGPYNKTVKDECKTTYGISENKGCPKEYFFNNYSIDGYVGIQFNSVNMNLPELNQLGYKSPDPADNGKDGIDINQSLKGKLKQPTAVPAITIGGSFAYYFDENKRHGLSIGFGYTKFSASYSVSDSIVYTYKSFDSNNYYRRRITIKSGSSEDITYAITNLPLLYNYRGKLDGDWTFLLSVGPSLMFFNSTSSPNANIAFEGLYQVDLNTNTITYQNPFVNGSSYNVYLTTNQINNQSSLPGADIVFAELQANSNNYDFSTNETYSEKQKKLKRTTVAVNARFDFVYNIPNEIKNTNIALKFGLQLLYAPLLEDSQNYTPIDKTTDQYNSLYNGKAKGGYASFGINTGVLLGW